MPPTFPVGFTVGVAAKIPQIDDFQPGPARMIRRTFGVAISGPGEGRDRDLVWVFGALGAQRPTPDLDSDPSRGLRSWNFMSRELKFGIGAKL